MYRHYAWSWKGSAAAAVISQGIVHTLASIAVASCNALCSNMYSALNAIAGHYNNFGTTAPIPKKRLDRLIKVSTAGLAGLAGAWKGSRRT